MSNLDKAVLVLSRNYEPLNVTNFRRAMKLIWLGKAEIIERRSGFVRSPNTKFPIPSIVRLFIPINRPKFKIQLTKKNILKRDRYICQYCGNIDSIMTVDHIVPRSRGGAFKWENLVCACKKCNNLKGDRTLKEVKMTLIRQPREPNYFIFALNKITIYEESWRPYIIAYRKN